MEYFRVKNLDQYQHYKDRNPPWIKLHQTVLDDYEFACLHDASKLHLVLIWLLASRSDNFLPYDSAFIQRRINATESVDLDALLHGGFIEKVNKNNKVTNASAVLADCAKDARPETETETETETDIETIFDEFWKLYPSRSPHQNPKKPARDSFARKVKNGSTADEIIAGAKRYADLIRTSKTEPQHVAQAVTFLNQERYKDQPDAEKAKPKW